MHILHSLSLLATIASLATSQQFVPTAGTSTFPQCAVGCQILMQTQSTCTPPNHVQATQLVYEDCFCQSPKLQDLYTTGETLCTSQCTSTADRQRLSDWFKNFCSKVQAGVDPSGGAATPTTLSTSTTSAAAAATSTIATAVSSGDDTTTDKGPWIKTHWQWIIMLLVLFFGFLALGFGARWLKKRHDRNAAQSRAAMSGFPVTEDKTVDRERTLAQEIWDPHQHMDATKGHEYTPNGVPPMVNEDANSKGKGNRVEITEIGSTASVNTLPKISRN